MGGCRCTLCHRQEDTHERADADAGQAALERQPSGLGPLLLVRVSAIANAWVHAQCLFWSPDVWPLPSAPSHSLCYELACMARYLPVLHRLHVCA